MVIRYNYYCAEFQNNTHFQIRRRLFRIAINKNYVYFREYRHSLGEWVPSRWNLFTLKNQRSILRYEKIDFDRVQSEIMLGELIS